MKKIFIPLVLFVMACTDDEGNPCIYEPTLTTDEATDIKESTATFNGVINNTSENCKTPNNIEQGFVYSTEIGPTLDDNQVNVNGTSISTTIENLKPNTTYYVRTFLTNSFGEFYGDEVSFVTNEPLIPDAPTITSVTTGDEEVEIAFDAPINDGGSTITAYTATSNPGEMTSTIAQAEGGTITVSGLNNGTAYTFTVTATNGVGTSEASEASDEVIPVRVPDAPTIKSVTAGNGQADVTFDAPTNDGGSIITEYTATSSPGNITSTISQAEGGTITVDGLTNGTTYTFTVTATNEAGTSVASDASNEVTAVGVPDAPTIISVTAGDGQVDVTFEAPTNDGGSAITEYTATSSPVNITSTIFQAEGGTITVDGLSNGTTYTFTVTATNEAGTSVASEASNAVTPYTYPEDTVHCDPNNPTEVVDVTNPATGKTWMDRNLGASQVAASSTDEAAYGDLYQWGRGADGHQCRDSQTTTTLSSSDQTGHGDFILSPNSPNDWLSPQNDDLWQGENGVNNPCPSGYRLPTEVELEVERQSWSNKDAAGAFASSLKLPIAGVRRFSNGSISFVGSMGAYWSATMAGTSAKNLFFQNIEGVSDVLTSSRALGYSVRCIKD